MKIEQLEANKIKITLSALDLDNMDINVKSLTPNSPRLHSFLYEIMEQVKLETGFNPYTGKVIVEATPHDDGITLLVTKLSEPNVVSKRMPKNIRAVKSKRVKKITYRFYSFEHLCGLFSGSEPTVFEKGSLYEYMENFYMVIPKDHIPAISEFADSRGTHTLSESFLDEHGILHAKGESLVKMAEGVKSL